MLRIISPRLTGVDRQRGSSRKEVLDRGSHDGLSVVVVSGPVCRHRRDLTRAGLVTEPVAHRCQAQEIAPGKRDVLVPPQSTGYLPLACQAAVWTSP